MINAQAWIPAVDERVIVMTDAGIFEKFSGQEGVVFSVEPARQMVTVLVNRFPLVLRFIEVAKAAPQPDEVPGVLLELLTRMARLGEQLRAEMNQRAVVGFGDNTAWRADIEDGRLKVWETTTDV